MINLTDVPLHLEFLLITTKSVIYIELVLISLHCISTKIVMKMSFYCVWVPHIVVCLSIT